MVSFSNAYNRFRVPDMACHVSQAAALDFANRILGRMDTELRFETEPLSLLQDLTRAVLNSVPFHNVFHLATPIHERRAPSLEENIKGFLSCRGGMCWTLNSAMYVILETLGYDVISVLASVFEEGTDDHAVSIVRNVAVPGDAYLVDVGFGYPSFHIVPLDFERESEVFSDSFGRYRLVKVREGLFCREHVEPDLKTSKEHVPGYYFKNERCDVETIGNYIDRNIYKSSKTHFYSSLRLVRFVEDKCIAIKDQVLLKEGEDHKLHPTQLGSEKEVMEVASKFFPEISRDLLEAALSNLKLTKAPGPSQ